MQRNYTPIVADGRADIMLSGTGSRAATIGQASLNEADNLEVLGRY